MNSEPICSARRWEFRRQATKYVYRYWPERPPFVRYKVKLSDGPIERPKLDERFS